MSTSGRDPAPGSEVCASNELDEALQFMENALGIIDRHEGPTDAGAHLDLAIHRLRAWIANKAK